MAAGGFYVELEVARRAFAARRQFNVIHMRSGAKIDLIIKKARPFSDAEFQRRALRDLPFSRQVSVVSAEDAVLSKLEWAKLSGHSERPLTDARAVLELNPSLNHEYVERWAIALGLGDLWDQVKPTS